MNKNITLSADAELVRRARAYALARQTTLNQMVRDYLVRIVGEKSPAEAAKQFVATALAHPGRSPSGWRFDRKKIHRYDVGKN